MNIQLEINKLIERNIDELKKVNRLLGGVFIGENMDGSVYVGGADNVDICVLFSTKPLLGTDYEYENIQDVLTMLRESLLDYNINVISLDNFKENLNCA